MYYVIETTYAGPELGDYRYVDVDRIDISTSPARKYGSGEVCIKGSCGSFNNWYLHAYGAYNTLEDAREAIYGKYGEVRSSDRYGNAFESDDEDVVETYKPGRYEPISSDATSELTYLGFERDIHADTSEERLAELVDEYEDEVNSALGVTLHYRLIAFMREYRQKLRNNVADEESLSAPMVGAGGLQQPLSQTSQIAECESKLANRDLCMQPVLQ